MNPLVGFAYQFQPCLENFFAKRFTRSTIRCIRVLTKELQVLAIMEEIELSFPSLGRRIRTETCATAEHLQDFVFEHTA